MRKWIVLIGCATLILLGGSVIGGYFYLRSHLAEFLAMAQKSLAQSGIALSYKNLEVSEAGLVARLRNVSVEGPSLPYLITADSLELGIDLVPKWPPLVLSTSVLKPVLTENPKYTPVKPSAPQPVPAPSINSTVAVMASALRAQLSIEKAELKPWGVEGLTAGFTVNRLKLGPSGLAHAELSHDVLLDSLKAVPWISNFHAEGLVVYESGKVAAQNTYLDLGPFRLGMAGDYDVASGLWKAQLSIPETMLRPDSPHVNTKSIDWLKNISGTLGLELSAHGKGPAFESAEVKGVVKAKDLHLTVSHPAASGDLVASTEVDFAKAGALSVNGKLNFDGTQAELKQADLFQKPRGVPLVLESMFTSTDGKLKISRLYAKFHNLVALSSGNISLMAPRQGDMNVKVSPTSLEGWERFFPKYSSIRSQGKIAGEASYQGPLEDWRSAQIDVSINADHVQIPLVKSWLSSKDLLVEGVVGLHSNTRVSYGSGALRNLTTDTAIDLHSNHIAYGKVFNKPAGVPLNLDLAIVSNGKKADVKKGDFRLGDLRAHLKGVIKNFTSPIAQLAFTTDTLSVPEILRFASIEAAKSVSNLKGALSARGSVSGPLTDKKTLPQVKGTLDLKHIAADYEVESTKKKIHLTSLSGPLDFTSDSVASRGLALAFPKSDGNISFQLNSFERPNLSLRFQSNRFAMSDFSDQPASGAGGPGIAMVPAEKSPAALSGAAAAPDFRKNPYLQSARLHAEIAMKNADLGFSKADSFTARIDYQNLNLRIQPAVLKTWGGTITMSTDWDGKPEQPVTRVAMKVANVDANQFIASYSQGMKDVIVGHLNTELNLETTGLTPEMMKRTAKGEGRFSLVNGQIRTLKFAEKPLEVIKRVPAFANAVQSTGLDEKINDVSGSFAIRDGKITLSNAVLRTPLFDVEGPQFTMDFDQNVDAKVNWYPKNTLISTSALDALKDSQGRPEIPLTISGPIRSPAVSLDQNAVQERLKQYAVRKLNEEKDKALEQLKNKAQNEIQNKVKEGLQNIFK